MIKRYKQFINENNSSLEKDMDYMVEASSDELLDDAIKMDGVFGEELLIKWLNWLQDDRDIYSDFGAREIGRAHV